MYENPSLTLPVPVDTAYLVTDGAYTAGCCGQLARWRIAIQAPGTLHLQIWRPVGSQFQLIGENTYSFNSGNLQTFLTQILNQLK